MADIVRLVEAQLPLLLEEIPDAPDALYMRGSLPPPEYKFLAVVGSRKMTAYGKDACESIIMGLRGYPISIISGLALGVDGCAHQSALKAGLHTIAVPGSGLNDDVLYPRAHYRLAQEILAAGGALLSEEEPNFRARPESFPKRNRIMAGMSHAIVVIEAGLQSGTLITARLATEYNRDVLAVPGSIFSENTEGPHLLLKLGATPIRNASDVLEALHIDETISLAQNTFSFEEKHVIDLLSEPKERDHVLRELGVPTAEGNALLLGMELKGLIKESLGMIRKV